jgi:hypothetical protein
MKPEFLTQLHVNVLSDDVSELDADFQYASAVLDQVITVPKGFHTDFASVPRFPGAYLLAGGKAKWEAVVHDYLCVHPRSARARRPTRFSTRRWACEPISVTRPARAR